MTPDLLATKLYIPPKRPNLVPRSSLLQVLNHAWQQYKKLFLFSAPAGYGKTTLVTEWLEEMQLKTAWLSLDKTDNDPVRFLSDLIAALRRVESRVGEHTLVMLQSPRPLPPDVLVTTLIDEITSLPDPFILVLDDYHLIESLSLHQQIGFLVENQPPSMHLVIATRQDPPFPLTHLRTRGQMVEIRQADLRFSLEECADFMQRDTGCHLSLDDVTALERRTEGWVAGLQLAALSMRGCDDLPGFIKAFSGSSHYVLDYLVEVVLKQQPVEVQDFLLKTAILDWLSGPLCDAVVNRSGSQAILDRLARANPFIIPLDQSRTWFRYHPLFADLFRLRLESAFPGVESELQRRASQWYATAGYLPEAINHTLAASDWERAAGLISDNSAMMLRRGELVTLLGWLKLLPDEVVFQRAQLCRYYGWGLTLSGQPDPADVYLQRAEAAVQGDDALLGTILVAQAYNLQVRGDPLAAIERAQRALALLPASDLFSRGLLTLTLGQAYMNIGNLKSAEQAFIEMDQVAQQYHNQYVRVTALTYLSVIQGIYGRLHAAADLCRQVIQLAGQSPLAASAYIGLGTLLYEWNDLESADQNLQLGIGLSQHSGDLSIKSYGYRSLATLQQARGESVAAVNTLQKVHQIGSDDQVSPVTRLRNAACHVQLALAQNDLATAEFWNRQVIEPAHTSPFYIRLGLIPARLFLAQNKKAEARARLEALAEVANQVGLVSDLVEVRTLQALAAAAPVEALNFLVEALQIAQPEGFVRTFVDKGEPMKLLLERLRSQGSAYQAYVLSLLAGFKETGSTPLPPQVADLLSERELEVLRLVAEGMSNREIAEQLVVTVGTVKTHIHRILDKLGVRSRLQAVAKARELGLL